MTYVALLFHHAAIRLAFAWVKSSLSRRNFVRIGSEKVSANKWGSVFCRLMATIASDGAIPGRMVLKYEPKEANTRSGTVVASTHKRPCAINPSCMNR